MITIANRRKTTKGEYVGRYMGQWCPGSVLGNPHRGSQLPGGRSEAIALYQAWLREQYRLRGPVRAKLEALADEYMEKGELTLICWCHPEPCHAEVIKAAIEKICQGRRAIHNNNKD